MEHKVFFEVMFFSFELTFKRNLRRLVSMNSEISWTKNKLEKIRLGDINALLWFQLPCEALTGQDFCNFSNVVHNNLIQQCRIPSIYLNTQKNQ